MKSDYALSALGVIELVKTQGVALGYYISRRWRTEQDDHVLEK
jgi:hypothetical protein